MKYQITFKSETTLQKIVDASNYNIFNGIITFYKMNNDIDFNVYSTEFCEVKEVELIIEK